MATRYAVANGNWNAPATWDGGASIPVAGDDVYANGFTVTVNQTITVARLLRSALASPVIAVNGGFVLNAGFTINLTADIPTTGYGSDAKATITPAAGGGTVTINMVSATAQNNNAQNVSLIEVPTAFTGICNINVSGSLTGNQGSSGRVIYVSGAGSTRVVNLNVTGDLIGASTTTGGTGTVLTVAGSGSTVNVNVTGNISGSGATVQVTGSTMNLTCNQMVNTSNTNAHPVNLTGGTTLIYDCDIRGSSTNGRSVSVSGTAIVTLRDCLITPGQGNSVSVFASTTTATYRLRISGDIYMGGILANSGLDGFMPIDALWNVDTGGAGIRFHAVNDSAFPGSFDGAETILSAYGGTSGIPVPADVRAGTLYGPSNTYTGALAVPPAASVAAGVPVGNTVGTGGVLLSDFADVVGDQLAAALNAS